MQKLYFVRHGLTVMNVKGLIAGGATETPLTDEGRQQAVSAGQHAKSLHIDCIVSSPQQRAQDTAAIIAEQLGIDKSTIHVCPYAAERDFGQFEGTPWAPDLNVDGFSDVETLDSLTERAKLTLSWLENLPAERILLVSHGSFGRAIRSMLDEQFPFYPATHLKNAEILELI